ncbi:MAG: multidrug transporter subunit MdtD [Desulfovibrio sp.]|jgi:EmrB/QacA subfamily drug resistance transporter|nr:multidrug transporter subunit MdtD [Desulfovibrio sp.]
MPDDASAARSGTGRLRILPWIVGIAFFMQMLDASILNTALPAIGAGFGTSPLRMHAVVIAYMLTVATLIPASGWIADRFGARRVFVFAIMLFTLGSLACAASVNLETLTAARVLQGTGGALLVPVGRLSVLRAFPRDQLVRVLSSVTIPGLLGPLMGPVLGGLLAHYFSWRWIFLINIPVGIVGIVLSLHCMPPLTAEKKPDGFDWTGFVFFGSFMIALTLSLEGLGENPLPLWQRLLMAALGVGGLLAYCVHALRSHSPLFSPLLFRTRNFRVGIIGNLFSRLGGGAMPFLTPLLLQVGLDYSPVKAGLTMLPLSLGAMIGKSLVDRLIKSLGFQRFLTINTLLVSLMLSAYSLIEKETPYLCILALFTAAGIVNSLQFTGMNTITLIDLPNEEAGGGNSLLSAVMQLSMGMGVAIAAALLDIFTTPAPSNLKAFHTTFLILGAVSASSAVIFSRTRNTTGHGVGARE